MPLGRDRTPLLTARVVVRREPVVNERSDDLVPCGRLNGSHARRTLQSEAVAERMASLMKSLMNRHQVLESHAYE